MTEEQITKRLLCLDAGVNEKEIQNLNQKDMTRISDAASRFANAKIFIDSCCGISTDKIREKCLNLYQKHKIDVVIIDYLQLITYNSSINRRQQIYKIMQELKQLACELNIPIVLLVQLDRESGKKIEFPHAGFFGDAKAVEQIADIIVLRHREREEGRNNKTSFIVVKSPTG